MESSDRVGIVAALAAEARTLGRAGRLPGGLCALADGSLIATSGMGFEAAERSARTLIDAGCGALVSWGLAGGLDPRLSSGTVLVPEVLILEGAPGLHTSSAWRAQTLEAIPAAAGGRLLTSPCALASAADKRQAFLESNAVAVDMESYAIAALAAGRGLPFMAIRVIVDRAADEVPAALLDAADARGRIAAGALMLRILGSPRLLVPMLSLARRYAVARRALRQAARAGAVGRP